MQSEQVLRALFKPVAKEGEKAWKMKRFSVYDFQVFAVLVTVSGSRFLNMLTSSVAPQKVVGQEIEATVRYDFLVLTNDVIVRWNADDGTMRCSGKYGKYGPGKVALVAADDKSS